MIRQLALALAGVAMASAQPAIFTGGVRNAASARYGLTSSGIAPRSWFVIQGRNLGPGSPERAEAPSISLGGTSVLIVSGGQQWDVPLLYASAGELVGRMPADVPLGDATVTIRAASGTTADAASIKVVASSFGVFTANQSDDATVIWDQFRSGGVFSMSALQNPLKPGDEVNLWGTGLGAAEAGFEIKVQDANATVVAQSTDDNGIDRVRIRVPDGANGCGLVVAAKSGDLNNLVGLLSVATDGGVCLDQTGFSAEDIEKARSSGGLKAAYLFLLRFGLPGIGAGLDFGFANFSRVSYDLIRGFRSNWAQTIPGACYAANTDSAGNSSSQGQPGADFFDDFYPFGESPLEAGPSIDVRGPGGPQQMDRLDKGLYSGLFLNPLNPIASYFTPGDYTLAGAGEDVGNFSANVRIGTPVTWQDLTSIQDAPRNQDLKLNWTGGSPGDRVWVAAYSAELSGTNFVRAGVLSCYEIAQKGSITIPASMLEFLPPSSHPGTGLLLLYSMAAPQRFQPSGGGLDAGYVLSLGYSAAPVTFK